MSRTAGPLPVARRRPTLLVLAASAALLVAVLVGSSVASAETTADPSLRVALDPASPVAGEPVTIVVSGAGTDVGVQCFLDGRSLITEPTGSAEPGEVRLIALLPAETTAGETTLVVTSRAADGIVRSTQQPVTVRPRDPWLDDASGGLALLGLALAVLALGTATIVAAHHRRRGRAPSDASAPE